MKTFLQKLTEAYYHGWAIYEIKNVPFLSDNLKIEEKISIQNRDVVEKKRNSFEGIFYELGTNVKITGYLSDKKYLEINWSLSAEQFSKQYSWKMAEAIQYSLSILVGENISILKRELRSSHKRWVEMRQKEKITSLGILSLFYPDNFLKKEYFVKLTELFAKNEFGSDVCRNIFNQMIEAARQENWQVRELLIATILEAALRNIQNQPFQTKKNISKKWNVGTGLKNFFQQYLSEEWINIDSSVMQAHTYLRDRNAHPDWLFTQGGTLSEEEQKKSLDSMIFLSKFYGYMILALAGFTNIKPIFPKPHSEWGSPIIINPTQ